MSLLTQQGRMSVALLSMPFRPLLRQGDNVIDQYDRLVIGWMYDNAQAEAPPDGGGGQNSGGGDGASGSGHLGGGSTTVYAVRRRLISNIIRRA